MGKDGDFGLPSFSFRIYVHRSIRLLGDLSRTEKYFAVIFAAGIDIIAGALYNLDEVLFRRTNYE